MGCGIMRWDRKDAIGGDELKGLWDVGGRLMARGGMARLVGTCGGVMIVFNRMMRYINRSTVFKFRE